MKFSTTYQQQEVGISANDFFNFAGNCGKAVFQVGSVCLQRAFHVTFTHDAFDLIIQDPSPPCHTLCGALLPPVQGPGPTPF